MIVFRLPYTLFVLGRGGVFGHLAQTAFLPRWLKVSMRGAHTLLAKRDSHERPGLALAETLIHLGPAFIKFGQALSTRADLLGADVAGDLTQLQDSLPPFKAHVAKQMLEAELGSPLEEIFSDFDDEPIAAASIAQVHFATLKSDGRRVAVKILRPRIRQKMERDIAFFGNCARLIEWLAPSLRKLKLGEVIEQFASISDIELDLRLEAAAASKLAKNHADDEGIYVPKIEWDLTRESVLVIERVHGTRIDDKEALIKAGHDIEAITRIAARCFFVQVFRDGYFHADMHPGNIFINKHGVLVPIDFGIMGYLSLKDRLFLVRLLNAMLERDYDEVAKLHADAGMIKREVSIEVFAQAIRAVTEPVMDKPMGEVSLGVILGQIFGLAQRFEVEVQPQFTLLQKTIVMAEGVGRQLNPDANMWPIARELAADWAESQQNIPMKIREIAEKIVDLGIRLPEFITLAEQALEQAANPKPSAPLEQQPILRRSYWKLLIGGAVLVLIGFFIGAELHDL